MCHFAAAKWPAKPPTKSPIGCEIALMLRNEPSLAKISTCEIEPNHSTISKGIPEDLCLKQSSPHTSGHPFSSFFKRPPTTPKASSSRPKKSASRPPKKKARVSAPVEPSKPSSKPQPPTIESQIPSGMTPEVIIKRPMVTQPPIEGNLDCRARSFHSELCFDRETFRLQPELRDSFHLLQRYHLEHLMTPRDFFYPRVALDFYQSMTTHRVRDPTVIHFTIDKRHGILGARHIAEALHIPYEPARPEDFRVWAHPSQSDMVHILFRGTSTCPYLLRKELPPSMFFLDALLRHNIYPLQHMVQRK
ncbi:hypothetical protein CK203_086292 [Vitis vinifera]|uniref:Uncharacterized protein n=1 Tax=Vitis vinifera TaxID=29760 RepID=A0A438EDD8_VITVI|nr:hypothetical protein CK203_086292 [Vitis vinifera]